MIVAFLPSLVTLIGAALGACALWMREPWLLFASLACDLADGALARALDAESDVGAELDFLVDVGLAAAACAVVGAWPALVFLALGQACITFVWRGRTKRLSFRAFVFVALAFAWWTS